MNYPNVPKTIREPRPDSVRAVYGRVGNHPVRLDIPVKVTQVRRVEDIKDLPEFQAHAFQVDGAWSEVIFDLEDIVTARPDGFVELTREQYQKLRAEREQLRAEFNKAFSSYRKK